MCEKALNMNMWRYGTYFKVNQNKRKHCSSTFLECACVCMCARACVCVSSYLSESLQRLLWPKDKLERDVFTETVRSPAGAQDVLGHFLQRGRADDPRVTQRGDDLVLQQPADLKQNQSSSSPVSVCVCGRATM